MKYDPATPLTIETTTILRVVGNNTEERTVLPSQIDTYSYIILNDVLQQPVVIPGLPLSHSASSSRATGREGPVPLDMEVDPAIVGTNLSETNDIPGTFIHSDDIARGRTRDILE